MTMYCVEWGQGKYFIAGYRGKDFEGGLETWENPLFELGGISVEGKGFETVLEEALKEMEGVLVQSDDETSIFDDVDLDFDIEEYEDDTADQLQTNWYEATIISVFHIWWGKRINRQELERKCTVEREMYPYDVKCILFIA